MSMKVKVGVSVIVPGGPSASPQREIELDGYDYIEAKVVAAAADTKVDLQPGEAKEVQLLLITADAYDPQITYKVDDDTGAGGIGSAVALDHPHCLIGSGAVSLLGRAPKALHFSNGTAKDVTARVLVGRKTAA
jgi:hypothetical protein